MVVTSSSTSRKESRWVNITDCSCWTYAWTSYLIWKAWKWKRWRRFHVVKSLLSWLFFPSLWSRGRPRAKHKLQEREKAKVCDFSNTNISAAAHSMVWNQNGWCYKVGHGAVTTLGAKERWFITIHKKIQTYCLTSGVKNMIKIIQKEKCFMLQVQRASLSLASAPQETENPDFSWWCREKWCHHDIRTEVWDATAQLRTVKIITLFLHDTNCVWPPAFSQ